jgi:hypothetical protein
MTFINSLLWPSRAVIVHYLAMLATIRVGLKVVDNDNTLAYYGTELITAVKIFIVQAPIAEIGAKTRSMTTFSIMTLSIKGFL